MTISSPSNLILVRRLLSFAELTETEERAVSGLTMHIREFRKDHDIIREGDRPSQCCVLLQGPTHHIGRGRIVIPLWRRTPRS